MVLIVFLKNGKTWKSKAWEEKTPENEYTEKCPYDNANLKSIYDYTNITGSMTEMPEDFLPKSFKKTAQESVEVFGCPTCQKRFLRWENDNWTDLEFHEVKVLPETCYEPRENEAVDPEEALKRAGMKEATPEWLNNQKEDDNSHNHNANDKKFRPTFYG